MNPTLKTFCLNLAASIIVLLISAPPAAPQGAVTTSVAPQSQTSAISTTPRFRGVKGAPYSGEEITETTQTLADGNEITNKRVTKVYRDSEGRIRSETTLFRGGADDAANSPPTFININDPAAGVMYELNTHEQTARKRIMRQFTPPRPAQTAGTAQQQSLPAPEKRPITIESKSESLGEMSIEGLEAHGIRTTFTYPAGMFGNALPIVAVREVWYSTDLRVPLLTKNDDPRTGKMVTRLTNISLDEPTASLFEVPPDYTILEEKPVRASGTNPSGESDQ